MKTFEVTAMQVNTVTGAPIGEARTERVDTSNPIFAAATGPWDVEDRYHAFWNRLNDSWESQTRSEKVVVLSVIEVK